MFIIFKFYVEKKHFWSKAKRKIVILVKVLKLSGEITNMLVKIPMIYFALSGILIEISKVTVIIKRLSVKLGYRNISTKNTNISFEYLAFSIKSYFWYYKIILVMLSFFNFRFYFFF